MNSKFLRDVLLVLVLSVVAVLVMYFDSRPVWIGLPIAYVLVICAGLIGGELPGAITGFAAMSVGIYVKINHYFVPEKILHVPAGLSGEKLQRHAMKVAEFYDSMSSFSNFLYQYALIFVFFAVLAGFLAGKYFKKFSFGVEENSTSSERVYVPKFRVKKLVYMSVFIALALAINSFRVGNVSFSGFPIIYSGLALGPVAGGLVGGIADIVGFLIRPSGSPFHIAFTFTSILTGVIPAWIVRIPGVFKYRKHPATVFVAILIAQTVTSVLLVPFFRMWLFDHPLAVTMTAAAVKQAYSIPMYTFFYVTVDRAVSRGKNA